MYQNTVSCLKIFSRLNIHPVRLPWDTTDYLWHAVSIAVVFYIFVDVGGDHNILPIR